MSSVNKVFLMGNLTRDPEIRYTPAGAPVVDFAIAMNEKYKNKAGEVVESVCFVEVEAWNRTAEICSEHLKKGESVHIEGSLKLDQWESKEGEKRSRLKVRTDRVTFLNNNKES